MALLVQVAVDCARPQALADFWAAVLGYEIESIESDEYASVIDPQARGPRILFHRVPEPKQAKNRLHLDVRAGGPRGTALAIRKPLIDSDVTRVCALGATHVRTDAQPSVDEYYAVLRDPEGNEFCIC